MRGASLSEFVVPLTGSDSFLDATVFAGGAIQVTDRGRRPQQLRSVGKARKEGRGEAEAAVRIPGRKEAQAKMKQGKGYERAEGDGGRARKGSGKRAKRGEGGEKSCGVGCGQ